MSKKQSFSLGSMMVTIVNKEREVLIMAKTRDYVITDRCVFCGKPHSVIVNHTDYNKWRSGALAQSVFDYLSIDDREFLISGICPSCSGAFFDSFEDYDESPCDGCHKCSAENCAECTR